MNRRGFLKGILAAGSAPFVVTTAGVLMPVRKRVWTPPDSELILELMVNGKVARRFSIGHGRTLADVWQSVVHLDAAPG